MRVIFNGINTFFGKHLKRFYDRFLDSTAAKSAPKNEKIMKNFSPPRADFDQFREKLFKACEGMVYSSETDSPVTPFFADDPGLDLISLVRASLGCGKSVPITTYDFEEFFRRLEAHRDWHGAEEKQIARRYARLRKLLTENLESIQVFKAGKNQIEIFIIGKTAEGKIAGIKTYAVET